MNPRPDDEPVTWLWPLLRPHRGAILRGSAAVLMSTGATLSTPYLVKLAIDHGTHPGTERALTTICLVYLALVGCRFWLAGYAALTVATVGQQLLYAVRRHVYDHVHRLPLSFYQHRRSGGVVALLTGDVDAAAGLVSSGVVGLATSLITFTGVAIVLVTLDWTLALQTLAVTPVLFVLVVWFRNRSAIAWRRLRDASSTATEELHEVVNSVREIQNFRHERSTVSQLEVRNQAVRNASRHTAVLSGAFFPGIEFISVVAMIVVVLMGGNRVVSGHMGIGTLAAYLLYLQILFGPIFGISTLYSNFQSALAGARRLGAVLRQQPALIEPEHPVTPLNPTGTIRLENVHFGYPTQSGASGPEVLHNISILIPAGSTLALVGETGAGKSTLAGVILRSHDPNIGKVTLDGVDLRELSTKYMRAAVGFVPQERFLFNATVADNITLGRPGINPDTIRKAVTALGVEALISRLPDGLNTHVGERGKLLASGERQAVALLRAYIGDPVVLVLDEATGQLDPDTETLLQSALRRLRRGRTTIIIAHQLVNVMGADQIAVVAEGRIIESGTPDQLLRASGTFSRLFSDDRKSQIGSVEPSEPRPSEVCP
jgi:ABC-type multidrug transport system fused ATPase/permease subunit